MIFRHRIRCHVKGRYRSHRLHRWLIALALVGGSVSAPLSNAQVDADTASVSEPPQMQGNTSLTESTWAAAIDPEHHSPADGASLPGELSAWTMYRDADWIVKTVMLLLLIASLACWMVAFVKALELRRAGKRIRNQNTDLRRVESLAASDSPNLHSAPAGTLLAAVADELHRSDPGGPDRKAGIKERAELQLRRLEMAFSRQLAGGTGLLASVGATAPFVGLFGTVWGIMNAFIGISRSRTTSLAVVAPGIAEALLATALGLAAAIPAVLLYNYFSRKIAYLRALLGDQSAQIMQLLSRDLDREQDRQPGRAA
jgi:biopolymer transport protein ExbB